MYEQTPTFYGNRVKEVEEKKKEKMKIKKDLKNIEHADGTRVVCVRAVHAWTVEVVVEVSVVEG